MQSNKLAVLNERTYKYDEKKEKVVDGRTYYWCPKCQKGKGMWALHKVHQENFKKDKKSDKKVSFSVFFFVYKKTFLSSTREEKLLC